jgi:beta-phosphoglucomutase-like phosphatase (HAD superfamily)
MSAIRLEACIFDMDGVISDTQKIHSSLEEGVLLEHGIQMSSKDITRRFSGVSGRDMWPTIFSEFGVPCPSHEMLSELVFERLMSRPVGDIVAVRGALELIGNLRMRNVPLAVGSGSRLVFIERVLGALDLRDSFQAVASAKEVAHGKPAPDVFLLAAKRLGIAPEACVVIEDGVNGMHAAKAAGMKCIALVEDKRQQYPADLVIERLEQFPLEWFH